MGHLWITYKELKQRNGKIFKQPLKTSVPGMSLPEAIQQIATATWATKRVTTAATPDGTTVTEENRDATTAAATTAMTSGWNDSAASSSGDVPLTVDLSRLSLAG
jgi:hypothetical protein